MWAQLNGVGAAGSAAINVALPVGWAAGDACLLIVECSNADTVATPSGWTPIPDSPLVQNTSPAHKLYIFERVLTSSETNPVALADAGDHMVAGIIGIRGALTTGLIVSNVVSGLKASSGTYLFPTITANEYDYILAILGSGDDDNNAKITTVNADPDQIIPSISANAANNVGNGGGWSLVSGIAEKTGDIDTISGQVRTTMTATMFVIALTPDPAMTAQLEVSKLSYGAIVETAPSDEIQIAKLSLGFIIEEDGAPAPPSTIRRWRAYVN